MQYFIQLPYIIPISKKRAYTLSMNSYRNDHYLTLAKAKIVFRDLILANVHALPEFNQITIEYKLYPGSRKRLDVSNVLSIVDKFFCDVLVTEGIIKDDNYQIIPRICYSFGEITPKNPHVIAMINAIN